MTVLQTDGIVQYQSQSVLLLGDDGAPCCCDDVAPCYQLFERCNCTDPSFPDEIVVEIVCGERYQVNNRAYFIRVGGPAGCYEAVNQEFEDPGGRPVGTVEYFVNSCFACCDVCPNAPVCPGYPVTISTLCGPASITNRVPQTGDTASCGTNDQVIVTASRATNLDCIWEQNRGVDVQTDCIREPGTQAVFLVDRVFCSGEFWYAYPQLFRCHCEGGPSLTQVYEFRAPNTIGVEEIPTGQWEFVRVVSAGLPPYTEIVDGSCEFAVL